MKKPIALRQHLEASVPELAKNPDKLHVIIEKGGIATRPGGPPSWEYRYTLNLIITDYTASADTLVLPILIWLSTNQPDLLADYSRNAKTIAFEAEIIDHNTVDLSLTLDLSESVIVRTVPGGHTCEHLDEPALPDLTGPTGWEMIANGETING